MDVIIEFRGMECVGMKSDRMDLIVGVSDRKNSCHSIVRGISFHSDLSIRNPMTENWGRSKGFFQRFKGLLAFVGDIPFYTFVSEVNKWKCNFGVVADEMLIEIGKT
jgi:hypothetical protein